MRKEELLSVSSFLDNLVEPFCGKNAILEKQFKTVGIEID